MSRNVAIEAEASSASIPLQGVALEGDLVIPHDGGHREFVTIPGATHLFSEPGALEQVALLARDWFKKYL